MNRLTRMLTMTGMGVFAAVTVGAAPAMATTGAAQGSAQAAGSAAEATASGAARIRYIDTYDSRRECNFAGRLGERRGSWDDYDCDRSRGGYALRVRFDSWGDWNDWDNDDWRGPWGHCGGHRHWDGPRSSCGGGGHHGHHGHHGHGGHHGHRGHRGHGLLGHIFRGHNGVGAVPGSPPPPGTSSPS